VKKLPTDKLSSIEEKVIAEIRALRASPVESFAASLLASPERLTRHFIVSAHGNVQLRLATIAREIGMEMRTLERIFFVRYQETMAQSQVQTRLAFSKLLLSIFPPTKLSAVAAMVGYKQVQDFNRFFKTHVHHSPSEWSREERARIAREEKRRR
jgi:transcriptional regulator GlxA family with amidase domain